MYNQVSGLCLQRGLYLGYIKLQASVEVLRVMVPNKMPSCVPHVKIRDCPNVSRYGRYTLFSCNTFNNVFL